jgi:hypothetical protein
VPRFVNLGVTAAKMGSCHFHCGPGSSALRRQLLQHCSRAADQKPCALRLQEQLVKSDALVGVLSRLLGRGLLPRFVIDEVHRRAQVY